MRTLILTLVAAANVITPVHGQQPAAQASGATARAFEVASVKPNKSGDARGSLRRQPGGGVTAVNIPLRTLIGFAHQVPPFMLLGGPEWVGTDRFDIVAKLEGDPPVVAPGSSADALTIAMRALLADRFALKVHRETREIDIYALVMARPDGRRGDGLRPSTQDCSPEAIRSRAVSPTPAAPTAPSSPVCGMQAGPGRIQFGGLPLSQFTANLGAQAGRLVVDRTGLTGAWDFELTFAAEPPRGPAPAGVDTPRADPDGPSLFTAIQEQLGLKLEATKGPVEVLIIDSVERPTAD